MESDHGDIGRRILIELGIRPKSSPDDSALYSQLYALGFLRGVEYSDLTSIYVENERHELSSEQRAYLDQRRFDLGTVTPWTVYYNDVLFMETKNKLPHSMFVESKLSNRF